VDLRGGVEAVEKLNFRPPRGGSHRFIVLTGRILVTVTIVLLLQRHYSVLLNIPHSFPAVRRWYSMTENRKLAFPSTFCPTNHLQVFRLFALCKKLTH